MSGVVILCDDLMFTSKVTATARAAGLRAAVARTPRSAVEKVAATHSACVLVDLHLPDLDLPTLLVELRQAGISPRVIGFGSHVDVETLKAARAAGCDLVLPRSKFVADLEGQLPVWAAPPDTA